MGVTVDHLKAGGVATVIRDFVDRRGVHHRAGERGRIERIEVVWETNEFAIEWQRGARTETMVFRLGPGVGPGNGRMRDYFSFDEPALPPRPARAPVAGPPPAPPPELPEPGPDVIVDADRYGEAIARVIALAAHRRFDEADAQLRAMTSAPTIRIATDLGRATEQHAGADDDVFDYLLQRTTNAWYAWGSEATSGGDGTARLLDIDPAMKRLRELQQLRRNR